MKYIYSLTIIVVISASLLISCNKDNVHLDEETSTEIGNGLKLVNYTRSNKTNTTSKTSESFSGTTIAVFDDEQVYKNYITDLETQVENWDDAFIAEWGHLNDEDLNAKEEMLNFDSEKPLTDFENQFGIISLRQKYLQEEENWLNNDFLNEATDPDAKPVYDFNDSEMTVLNSLAEVQIGSTIVKKLSAAEIDLINNSVARTGINVNNNLGQKVQLIEEGNSLIIEESDYDALIDFNNGDTSVLNNDNVSVSTTSTASGCDYGKTRRKYFNTASNKKIKAIIKVPQPKFGANGKVKTKIKSYKKKWYGWKKWRTNIACGSRGNVYDTSCSNSPYFINDWTPTKKKKKRKFIWDDPYYGSHRVENGGMTGLYKQNSYVKELKLTW